MPPRRCKTEQGLGGLGAAMHLAEAVIGISQYVVPGVLALGFGEIKRDGESVPLLSLLWAQAQRRNFRRTAPVAWAAFVGSHEPGPQAPAS